MCNFPAALGTVSTYLLAVVPDGSVTFQVTAETWVSLSFYRQTYDPMDNIVKNTILDKLRSDYVDELVSWNGQIFLLTGVEYDGGGTFELNGRTSTEDDFTVHVPSDHVHGLRIAERVVTVRDICDSLLDDVTYDGAIPIDFQRDLNSVTDGNPSKHIVWVYEDGSAFGRPRPLTEKAERAIMEYDAAHGTNYYDESDDTVRLVTDDTGSYILRNR